MMEHIGRYFCRFEKKSEVSFEALEVWQQIGSIGHFDENDIVYPRVWDTYKDTPSIVLLGPPRSGKTTEFKIQSQKVCNGFLVELRDVDFGGGDLTCVWDAETQQRWDVFVSSGEKGELFIDSLDEGRLETPQALKKVVHWVNGLDNSLRKRLRIHLSCREFEWNRVDQNQWEKLFPPIEIIQDEKKKEVPGFIALAILPLDSRGILSYLFSKGIDKEKFCDAVPQFAEKLLDWPQSLSLLADLFLTGHAFGNMGDLYSKVIEKRIQETNERRSGVTLTSLSHRLEAVRELAAISYLSGCEMIALQQAESDKEVDAGLTGKSLKELRDIVNSELFETYTEGKVRFEDRSISAFLAAEYLVHALSQHTLTCDKLVSLLYSDKSDEEVVPLLKEVAGWLASFSSDVRKHLIQRSPSLFLSDDYPSDFTDEIKWDVWQWMKQEFGDREWFDDRAYESNAGKLVCEQVINDALSVLAGKNSFGRDLRIFTLSIFSKGKVNRACDAIFQVLSDSSEHEMVRRYALRAYSKIAPDKLSDVKSLLQDESIMDGDLELLGGILSLLYPNHLSVEEVLEHFDRSKSSDHYGMFQSFVHKVAEECKADDRATILDYLAEKLNTYLDKRKNRESVPDWIHTFSPELSFDDFLLPQLRDWGELSDKFPHLEMWLHTLARANTYGLSTGHKLKDIQELLQSNHQLRQQCIKIRIERLYVLKGNEFKPYDIHLHDRLHSVQAEDLEFWQQVVIDWVNEPENKLEAAWEELRSCWHVVKEEKQQDILDWLEESADKYSAIAERWDRNKVCIATEEAMQWRWKRLEEKKDKKKQEAERIKAFITAIPDIRQGHEAWIQHLVSRHFGENKNVEQWLLERVGEDAVTAFSEGLSAYWENSQAPEIDAYISNQIPHWHLVMMKAVESWLYTGGEWCELDSLLRQKAIRAGLWSLNDVPDWFFDAVSEEVVWANAFFTEVLQLENKAERELVRVLHLFSGHGEKLFVRHLVTSFLLSDNLLHEQMAKQLLKLLCEKADEYPIEDSVLDGLWGKAQAYMSESNWGVAILFAATVFRFRQDTVWNEIESTYLKQGDSSERFTQWLHAIGQIHMRFRMEAHWPVWMSEQSLARMLPYMYKAFPPEQDPGIKGYNQGQYTRSDMGRLRDEAITLLAENGTTFAGKVLMDLLSQPWITQKRKNWVLHNVGIWKAKHAHVKWVPLHPNDVKQVVLKGGSAIRSADELFDFVCDLLNDIRNDIENGEENIRTLLWDKDTPKVEKELQKLIARDLRKAIDARKADVVSGQELEVGGNFPDVFVTCNLPNGQRARVFIEIKRQMHNETLRSIKNQLVEKYLSDADTSHGIYLVGWYGSDKYGSYKRAMKVVNSKQLPDNPKSFEEILQEMANSVKDQNGNIVGLEVFVFNLEVQGD